ncbi:MAG: D-alanyl-D-alanine carboxypeptidase family protein [Faecousia sp.]
MKKKRMIVWLLFFAAVMQMIYLPASAANQGSDSDYSTDSSVIEGCHTIDAKEPLMGDSKMLDTAQGAFLYEVNTDTVVYAWHPDEKLPPASLVKMLTCIIAIENADLDDEVMVTGTALAAVPEYYHGDMGLIAGEVLTLRDLLYLTMVSGSNDAAAVVAEYIGGSQAAFVEMINRRATEIGCTNSHFVDAHGIKQTDQYTTARDVAKIVRECMKNEDFMEFFSCQRYEVPATDYYGVRIAVSTHPMMSSGSTQIYYNKRITGARTGVTQERWRTIATTSQSGDLTYISVVLCAIPTFHDDDYSIKRYGSYEETLDLLKLAYSGMRRTQVLSADQITIQYPVIEGLNYLVAGPNIDAYTILPSDITLEDLEFRYINNYASLNAPVKEGDVLTTLQVWYKNVCLAQSDLIAKNTVYSYNSDAAITIHQREQSKLMTFVKILVVILIVVVVFLVGSRVWNTFRHNKSIALHKRRMAGRRRSR